MTELSIRAREWKRFRRKNLLSQVDLAQLLDISRRSVQNVELGKRKPFVNTLRKFAVLKGRYERGNSGFEAFR